MTSDRRSMPRSLLLLGVAAAVVIWASAGVATAQDNSAPAKQDAKAQEATKAKQDAASAKPAAAQVKRINQPPSFKSIKNQPARPAKSGPQAKVRAASPPKATVVLKAGELPNIKFDTPNYNFGRVRAGQPIKHDFWFTNTGTGPLEILRVKPS